MLIAPIKKDKVPELRTVLEAMNTPCVADNKKLPFGKLQRVHFARFVILDADEAHDCQASLVFSTCYDPPGAEHLSELLDVGEAGLREVFAFCEGFPESAIREDILAFMQARRKKPETFYIGVHGRSLIQIRAEAALRDHIEQFLDKTGIPTSEDARQQIYGRIQQDVLAHKDKLGWAAEPDAKDTVYQRVLDWRGFAVVVAAALVVLGVFWVVIGPAMLAGLFVLVFGAWLLLLLLHEFCDRRHDPLLGDELPPDKTEQIKQRIKRLAEFEDRTANNQFTSLNLVKPGPFRKFTQWVVLTAINFIARYFSKKGSLSGIPTIHFARWVMVDGGKRLLFESNYDGSWERYLGDFVDKAKYGLTAVWSNTVGFPPSCLLFLDGAADEQPFKSVARTSQIETQVWYSAYPQLTTKNISNNREIHRGLFGNVKDEKTKKWLARF